MPEFTSVDPVEGFSSNASSKQNYNFGLEGVSLMYGAEQLHHKKLSDLDEKQEKLEAKLTALKNHLARCYKHLKEQQADKNNKDKKKLPIDLSEIKESVMSLWNEWKDHLKKTDLEEYKSLKVDLDKLDFSNMSLEKLEDELIPELGNIQRHHEFKYQKIPNELRLAIELFTILVEILKEFPKKYSELNGHINRSMARG